MKKAATLLAVAILGLASAPASAERRNIGRLYDDCRTVDQNAHDGLAAVDHDGALCMGYMTGLRDGLSLDPKGICIHQEVGNIQLTRVYRRWAEAHPERHHEDAVLGALTAFREAFPCPGT